MLIDTLPPAERDETLFYEGFWDAEAQCRLRLYTAAEGVPVVVLTETPDNPSTSITNKAERAHYLAWRKVGSPWPCRFAEHYPGEMRPGEATPPGEKAMRGEHIDWVEFAAEACGPRVVCRRQGGTVVTCPNGLENEAAARRVGDEAREFASVDWKPLSLEEFRRTVSR